MLPSAREEAVGRILSAPAQQNEAEKSYESSHFIEIPIGQQSAQIDALGPAAFLEVGGPIAGSFFGSDIVTLDYKANPLLFPGQQIVVSSRQWRSGSLAKAGRAYSFTP